MTMTKQPSNRLGSESLSQGQVDRIAKLQASGKRARHPALGARIVSAGVGASAMFGMIAALGFSALESPAGGDLAPATSLVDAGVPTTTEPPIQASSPQENSTVVKSVASFDAAPVELKANPVVRIVEVQATSDASPTPIASTNGSR